MSEYSDMVEEARKELNDMGFSNSYICEILNMDIRVIGGFSSYSTSVEANFIKLKEGLAEIRKQDKDKGDD